MVEAVDWAAHEQLDSMARSMLDQQTFAELWKAGSGMTFERAAAYALE